MTAFSGLRPLLATGALMAAGLSVWVTVPTAHAAGKTCRGKPATMVVTSGGSVEGTPGDDVIVVTGSEPTVVQGLAGDDTICSGGGADTIAGDTLVTPQTAPASDDDTIDAGAGNDEVIDDWGDDTLSGGVGADQLVLGVGTDDLYDEGCFPLLDAHATLNVASRTVTGFGKDTFDGFQTYVGGVAHSVLRGTSRPDDLRSGFCGQTHLAGLGGADRLEGDSDGSGLDGGGLITAGRGNDRIFISGPYAVHAGPGDDRIRLESSDLGGFTPRNEIEGNGGTDWLIDDSRDFNRIDLRHGIRIDLDWLPVRGVENARIVHHIAYPTHRTRLIGTAERNVLVGPAPDPEFDGTYHTILRGLGGNDRLLAGRHDTAQGGPGRDFCHAQHRINCERH